MGLAALVADWKLDFDFNNDRISVEIGSLNIALRGVEGSKQQCNSVITQ